MKFEILNRWTLKVQFIAEITCEEAASLGVKRGMALRDAILRDAILRDAILSGAILSGAILSGAVLSGAILSGADLRGAILSGADLRDAILSDADLSGAILSGADLRGAILSDADLSGADLSGAILRGADLRDAILSGADGKTNLKGVPFIENIHQKVYEAAAPDGALEMCRWHTCGTTHCRAGWVVTLVGDAGAALEFGMGTAAAAAMIYMKSDPTLKKIPDFYDMDNKSVLEDMKRLADEEAVRTK